MNKKFDKAVNICQAPYDNAIYLIIRFLASFGMSVWLGINWEAYS